MLLDERTEPLSRGGERVDPRREIQDAEFPSCIGYRGCYNTGGFVFQCKLRVGDNGVLRVLRFALDSSQIRLAPGFTGQKHNENQNHEQCDWQILHELHQQFSSRI